MSESDTDNIIQDLKSKPQIAIKGNTSDFLKKFSKQQADEGKPSSTNVGDPMLGMKQEESEPSDYEAEQESYSVNKEDITSDRKGKKKGFVERQIEENRKLKEELERQLSEQVNDLRGKLDFHDITSNPEFKKNYVEPIKQTYDSAKKLLNNDPTLLSVYARATAANAAMYNATSEEDLRAAEATRDEAFDEITNSLSQFKQYQFAEQVNSFIKATQTHHNALLNFEQTKQNIIQTTKQREQDGRNKFLNEWKSSYKTTQEEIDSQTSIPDHVSEYMKEKGIKYDISRDEAIALSATQQSTEEASVEEMNRLIHQGRSYKKLQAQLKAYQSMVKEKDDYIEKLKGSSRITASPKSNSPSQLMSLSEGLAAKLARFGPRTA